MPGVILGTLAYITSLKCYKNLLEGIKDYSEIGNPSKRFQLETLFSLSFFLFALDLMGEKEVLEEAIHLRKKRWETKYYIMS